MTSAEPLRCLLLFSPGGCDEYVRATSELIGDRPATPAVAPAFQHVPPEYGVEVIGTPENLF